MKATLDHVGVAHGHPPSAAAGGCRLECRRCANEHTQYACVHTQTGLVDRHLGHRRRLGVVRVGRAW
eukprot:4305138-Prymnesium_polylepis.1